MKRSPMLLPVAAAALLAAGCNELPMTYGDHNSVIAVTSPERWERISDVVYERLERTVQTVRDEKTFTVTYQEPGGQYWGDLRRFRQMLLIGTAEDSWIREAMDASGGAVTGPGVHQVEAVWSRDQVATLIVLPPDGSVDGLGEQLDRVYELLDEQFRRGVRQRMYLSGVNTALADTLAAEAGFRLVVPQVYRWARQDSVLAFRNDNPDPSELIREITVTWRSPAMGSLGADDVRAWRQEIGDAFFAEPQVFVEEGMTVEETSFEGHPGIEIQAQWRNPPDRGWPAGGPLITRALTCDAQDRTYLIDAWLYAPGKEKYEYMVQLETILDTFRCEV